jgi:hypothetical protein
VAAVLAAALVVLWNAAIYFDSSALTAGTVQAADKGLRGDTMGLHGMCGYVGGFGGPLRVGPPRCASRMASFGHGSSGGRSVAAPTRRAASL